MESTDRAAAGDREKAGGRGAAALALVLLVPAPSLGVAAALWLLPGPTGQTLFVLSKIWLVLFPAAWWLAVERGAPSWSPPRAGGLWVGALSGLLLGALIFAGYWAVGRGGIDPELVRQAAERSGIGTPVAFLTGAAGWVLVNSLLEEYCWRWFVFSQCRRLLPPVPAVLAAAAAFTAHHVVALAAYLEPGLTALASLGVFLGGAVWSWCYLRYRSVWPPWLSHVVADVVIFAIGWHLVFGG